MYRLLIMYHKPKPEEIKSWEEHYFNVHIPLAKKIPNAKILSVSKAVDQMEGINPYHLIATMEWESKEAMQEALQTPDGKRSHDDFESFAKGKVTMVGFEVNTLLEGK